MGDTVAIVNRYANSEVVLVLPLSLAVGAFPWRVKGASVSDCACHACLLATLLLAAFFAEDRHLTEVANLCFIVVILTLRVLPIGLGVAGKAAQKSNEQSSNILAAITSRVQAPRRAF